METGTKELIKATHRLVALRRRIEDEENAKAAAAINALCDSIEAKRARPTSDPAGSA